MLSEKMLNDVFKNNSALKEKNGFYRQPLDGYLVSLPAYGGGKNGSAVKEFRRTCKNGRK